MKKNIKIYEILLLIVITSAIPLINNCGDSRISDLIGKWVSYDYDCSLGFTDFELFSDRTFKAGFAYVGSWTILDDGRLKMRVGELILTFSFKNGFLIGLDEPIKNK